MERVKYFSGGEFGIRQSISAGISFAFSELGGREYFGEILIVIFGVHFISVAFWIKKITPSKSVVL